MRGGGPFGLMEQVMMAGRDPDRSGPRRPWPVVLTAFGLLALSAAPAASTETVPGQATPPCQVELLVLGVAQDAGLPQIGVSDDPAWVDPGQRRLATSLALIDRRSGARYLFDATPDIREQMHRLDRHTGDLRRGLRLNGVFLTHAHIGHYAGLMMLGREAAATRGVPVYAMPRMRDFLRTNGPWSQLVALNNVRLTELDDRRAVDLAPGLTVTPVRVPHRDEYSETVGFLVRGSKASALYLPDIDDWDSWRSEFGVEAADLIRSVDAAYIDATFYDDGELPPALIASIPHPRIVQSMARFGGFSAEDRARVRFIHLNHTNPAIRQGSVQAEEIERRGFRLAREGETLCLA